MIRSFFCAKNAVFAGVVSSLFFVWILPTWWLQIQRSDVLLSQNECIGDYQTINRYIPNGATSTIVYPKDRVWSNSTEFILNTDTVLEVRSRTWLTVWPDCVDSSRHFRQSSVSPGSNTMVDAFAMPNGSGCTLNRTAVTSAQDRTVQFAYRVAYQPIALFSTTEKLSAQDTPYFYIPSSDKTQRICLNGSSWINGTPGGCQPLQYKANRGTTGYYDKECLNYVLHWCWDGVLDTSDWEQCDPADPTHTGWGQGGCSGTCTQITNGACQNGGVNGQQANPVTLATPGLCQAGQTAQNLRDVTTGTRHDYTWECRAANGDVFTGGTCSAWWDSNQNQPTCQSLVVQDVAGQNFQNLPTTASCTCTAGAGFSAIESYHFAATGANPGDSGQIPDTANTHTWQHPITSTGVTNVACDITGLNLTGTRVTVGWTAACAQWFFAGNPNNACVRGNMTIPPTAPVTITTPGLCPAGQTPINLVSNGTNPINYTWSCQIDGTSTILSGGNCNAAFSGGANNCNAACTQNSDCTGYANPVCSGGFCRNSSCTGETDCDCGGGGQTPICDTLTLAGNTYTCQGNGASAGATGTCELRSAREGGTLFASGTMTNGRCDITYAGAVSSPVWCVMIGSGSYVFNNNLNTCTRGWGGGGGGGGGWSSGSTFCGDKAVQCPNSRWECEMCDGPAWCTNSCAVDLTLTNPGGASFFLSMPERRIVGGGITVFKNNPVYFIANTRGAFYPYIESKIVNTSNVISGQVSAPKSIGCNLISSCTPQEYTWEIQYKKQCNAAGTNCQRVSNGNYVHGINEFFCTVQKADPSQPCDINKAVFWDVWAVKKRSPVSADGTKKLYKIVENPTTYVKTLVSTPGIRDDMFEEYQAFSWSTQKVLFSATDMSVFKGNARNIPSGAEYKDTITERWSAGGRGKSGDMYVQYGPAVKEYFDVRVSKSIMSNTSGWNANNPSGAKVNTVAGGFIDPIAKGNFTTTAQKASGSWSLTKTTGSGTTGAAGKTLSGSTINRNANGLPITITTASNLISFSVFKKLGDRTNVFVAPNGLTIDTPNAVHLSGVATVIVESGSLVINQDILYKTDAKTASWAFIVKNGNIIVKKSVKNLAGVYMTLSGKILPDADASGDFIDSPYQLKIDGSLYGDPGELVTHRTYVYGTASSSALATGVVINYSNRALKSPPPMLTNFIETYKLKKVSK